jgi:hypothetical protein
MTLAEFKAWFDGFTEGFSGPPTAKQWARVCARVKEIDGEPVTERIFIDRYWPIYPNRPYVTWGMNDGTVASSGTSYSSACMLQQLGRVEATLD